MSQASHDDEIAVQRRTTLASIAAAGLLVALKLGVGLATGSLALVSAGVESSGDVVAATLTFFAVRLGGRPADRGHPYGHRRAENLGALGEAAILLAGGVIVSVEAIRHLLGADMALDLPFGIGPLQFHNYFPEDTHNSYLNAFMSGGWIAGICYPALVFVTVIMGFRHVFIRVPWQRAYLAIFSAFLGTVGESFIIDTDHWRHFWMMLGAMWGMFAAAQRYKSAADQPLMVPGQAS